MRKLGYGLILSILAALSPSAATSQQGGEVVSLTAYETVYNEQIAIFERCEVFNAWGAQYYTGVLAWQCRLVDHNGAVDYSGNSNWGGDSWIYTYFHPLSTFGSWNASFQSWIGLYQDEYFSDNGFYDDPDGYAYLGVQSCGSSCTLDGNGYLASLYHQTEQFANSSMSLYIAPVSVQVYPSSASLYSGEQQIFTASVAGVAGGPVITSHEHSVPHPSTASSWMGGRRSTRPRPPIPDLRLPNLE